MTIREFKGIDLSKHNRVESWTDVVHKSQVDFVILRAGGHFDGFYKDSAFERYYNACKQYEIPVGAYFDCGKHFRGAEFGRTCAQKFAEMLSGKQFELPVFMDIEVTPSVYRHQITEATISFCKYMEEHGYFTGIYASDISGFKERLEYDRIQDFTRWCARYGRKPAYCKSYQIWQYTSKGTIEGIKGPVDLDSTYIDYPSIIKKKHFNGF